MIKRLTALIAAALLLCSCGILRRQQPAPPSPPQETNSASGEIATEALSYLGKNYCTAGNGPDCFDCSGFTVKVFSAIGTSLPRTAAEQAVTGTPVGRKDLRQGDLVFFARGGRVFHVGIVLDTGSDGTFSFIHASSSSGIIVSSSENQYWKPLYHGGRRIIP